MDPRIDTLFPVFCGQNRTGQAAVSKAQAQIAEFRKFQRLVKAVIEVNTKICRLREDVPRLVET
jgi:hypothetical protein